MAVNENLYNWMFKTYGMQPAEWYRNNPTKPPASNPFLPKGSYVPKAEKQPTGPRGELLASVSKDPVQYSVIEPAPKAIETEDQKFQRFYNQSKQQLNIGNQILQGEYAAGNGLYYNPNFGEYGGYLTKNNPDQAQVARVREMMAQQAAGTADSSWAGQDLSNLISVTGQGGWHVRSATESDPEVQKFGIYNVGRSDYMQNRRNQAIQKNIEILKQQAAAGNQSSQQALQENAPQEQIPERGPKGEDTFKERGPRGENMGDIASIFPPAMTPAELYRDIKSRSNASPGTKEYGELRDLQKEWIQRQKLKGAEAPEETRPVFDEQKALLAKQSADQYRRRGQAEDPFRSGSFG